MAIAMALAAAACAGAPEVTVPGVGGGVATTAGRADTVPERFNGIGDALYAGDTNWLCRPGMPGDHCTTDPLDATVLASDGSTTVAPRVVATDPVADCFYVYPTVNLAPGGGNQMDLSHPVLEAITTDLQAGRFADVCSLYAPLYRQMNLSGYTSPRAERDKAEAFAYRDVRDAFSYYMAHYNKGRPIVLIGHSQGSAHLARLVRDEFDADENLRSRLVSALLIGGDVKVPKGKDVGGSFSNIALCRSTVQTACVVAFNSFGTNPPPDTATNFGRVSGDGLEAACVNPAAPAGGSGTLKPLLPPDPAITGGARIETRFVDLPDAFRAECRREGQQPYLGITVAAGPGDRRNVAAAVTKPGSVLHLTEVNLTLGNLLGLVRSQVGAMHPSSPR